MAYHYTPVSKKIHVAWALQLWKTADFDATDGFFASLPGRAAA
jgi:hypothetical protein